MQTAAQSLVEAVGDSVVAEYHFTSPRDPYWPLDEAHGVSIYFPSNRAYFDYLWYVGGDLFKFTSGNRWDEFLAAYLATKGLPTKDHLEPQVPPVLVPPSLDFIKYGGYD